MKLAALFSGGKDSTFALYKAMEKNEIVCLITIKSINPDSYMFHTPNIDLTEKQAEALALPLITVETEGQKEKELVDLKNAIKKAVELFNIKGIVTGALKSEYQKSRIQKICDDLKLKCLNPLWQKDQEKVMREIIDAGFEFIIVKIAALGFDKNWLGKVITESDVNKLVELEKKYGINIAFEGGEAESLMIDGPIFKSKLQITDAEIDMENDYTGVLKLSNAKLITKF